MRSPHADLEMHRRLHHSKAKPLLNSSSRRGLGELVNVGVQEQKRVQEEM